MNLSEWINFTIPPWNHKKFIGFVIISRGEKLINSEINMETIPEDLRYFQLLDEFLLTHCSSLLLFYTPWKQKAFRFSDVLGGIEKQHRAVMG